MATATAGQRKFELTVGAIILLVVLLMLGWLVSANQQKPRVQAVRSAADTPPSYAECMQQVGHQTAQSAYLSGPLEDTKTGAVSICIDKNGWRVPEVPGKHIEPVKVASTVKVAAVADAGLKKAVLAATTTVDKKCGSAPADVRTTAQLQPGLYTSGDLAIATPNECLGASYRTGILYKKTADGWQVVEDTNKTPGPGLFRCSTLDAHKVPLLLLMGTGNTDCWTADGRLKDLVSGTVY